MTFSHDIADYPEGIVLAVDKPYRWTSADVIRKLKFAAIRHFAKKNLKVGHAGTLDPLATGVLLVCIGPACKRAQELQDHDKEYIARIRFGATTPSYDLEKDVDRRFPYEHITKADVEAALPAFLGEQEQVAPLFSAKSVDGVRVYELARKRYKVGLPVEEEGILQASRINIYDLQLVAFNERFGLPSPSDPVRGSAAHPSQPSGWAPPSNTAEGGMPLGGAGRTGSASSNSTASNRINVASVPEGLPQAEILVDCSKGTYIRALARDLGEALGSGAFLHSLRRTRNGGFAVENALSIEEVGFCLKRD